MLAFLSGCSSTGQVPTQYTINGEGSYSLNRDINGNSLSVVVRIYQLKDADEFSKLTFDTLAAGYPETDLLGTSLLSKTDMILVPGGSYASSEKLLEETRFIGVVGLFRNPDPHHWRQLVETHSAKGNRTGGLTFRAQDCHITIVGSRSLLLPGQPAQPKGDCGMGGVSSAPALSTRRPPSTRSASHERQAATGSTQAQASTRLPSMPEVNVNFQNTVAPATVQFGGAGGASVTVGNPSPTHPTGGNPSPPAYYSPPGVYVPAR